MLTIGLWLLKAVGFFKSLLGGLVKLITEHPGVTALIVVVALLNYGTYHYTKNATDLAVREELAPVIEKLTEQVKVANAEVTARNEKIEVLEKESKTQADAAAVAIANTSKELDRISGLYRTAKANAKIESYAVTLPAKKDTPAMSVNVQVEAGNVVCNRFPSSFLATINSMVDAVNSPLELKPTSAMLLTEGVAAK